ncbi:hypothetical protein ACJX0J_014541, partial [Zea mays]
MAAGGEQGSFLQSFATHEETNKLMLGICSVILFLLLFLVMICDISDDDEYVQLKCYLSLYIYRSIVFTNKHVVAALRNIWLRYPKGVAHTDWVARNIFVGLLLYLGWSRQPYFWFLGCYAQA